MKHHRVRMHKWQSTPRDLPNELFEYIPLFDDVKQILRRANGNSREFVVETIYVPSKKRSFPIDREKVKEFIDTAPEEAVILPGVLPTVVLDRWVAGGGLIEDEQAEESDSINMIYE